jgi:hypothetical protein
MKKTTLFIVLALLIQAGWFLYPSLNIQATPYRYDQRQKAVADWAREKTPETRSAFDSERQLLRIHMRWRAGVLFTLFLVVDGVGIYYILKYGRKQTVA